jgi:hypothetical protein
MASGKPARQPARRPVTLVREAATVEVGDASRGTAPVPPHQAEQPAQPPVAEQQQASGEPPPATQAADAADAQTEPAPEAAGEVAVMPRGTAPAVAAPAAVTARRATGPRLAAPQPDLWEQIVAAGADARASSHGWSKYSPNLPENLWLALKRRRADDFRVTRRRGVDGNHYIQVALMRMPRRRDRTIDADAVIKKGREWLASQPDVSRRASTGSNLTNGLVEDLFLLSAEVDSAQPKIYLWVIIAAYVQQLLDDLADTAETATT